MKDSYTRQEFIELYEHLMSVINLRDAIIDSLKGQNGILEDLLEKLMKVEDSKSIPVRKEKWLD